MHKILVLFLLMSSSKCDVVDFQLSHTSTAMTHAIVNYIVNFYRNISSTVNIYHVSEPENTNVNMDIINEVLHHVKPKIVVQIESLLDLELSTTKRITNIMFVDSLDSFMKIFEKIDYEHFEYQGYFLMIVTVNDPNTTIYTTMQKIFEALWTKHIINSNIIFMPSENTNDAMVFTYYPYSKDYCEYVQPILLNQFHNHRWIKDMDYFPKKMRNFHGCYLNVAPFENLPFMTTNIERNGITTVDGIEGILLNVLSKRLNFNINYKFSKKLWGYIYKNKTYLGVVKMIVQSEVNMTIGFFSSDSNYNEIMQPSYSYYTTDLVWMVPPGKPQTALEKLANPLQKLVWIMSIVTFAIGITVIVVIKHQEKVVRNFVFGNKMQSPAINLINVVLGNSLHQVPMRNFARFLLLIAMSYFFIIRTCYSSGLVKFMQKNTRGQHMMTTAKMVKNNFSFFVLGGSSDFLHGLPGVPERIKFVRNGAEFDKLLSDMMNDPYYDGSFLTSKAHLAYRNMKVYPKLFHESAPEGIYTLSIVIYLKQGSSLTSPFNDLIINFVSSGLMNKWASKFIDNRYLKKPKEDELKILSLDQLEGAFQLLIAGNVAAFVVFCAENIIARKFFQKFMRSLKNELSSIIINKILNLRKK